MPSSSSGLGQPVLSRRTGVRLPLGVGFFCTNPPENPGDFAFGTSSRKCAFVFLDQLCEAIPRLKGIKKCAVENVLIFAILPLGVAVAGFPISQAGMIHAGGGNRAVHAV